MPAARFGEFRADLERNFHAIVRSHLGERADQMIRAERFRGTPDLPNVFRKPYGPGWALVGDAGLVMDPITGQGIGNAMCDAEVLAGAVVSALDGSGNPAHALRRFHKWRDRARTAMYEMTSDISSFQANPRGDALFEMLATNERGADRFLGVLTGVVRPDEFFSPVQMMTDVGNSAYCAIGAWRDGSLAAETASRPKIQSEYASSSSKRMRAKCPIGRYVGVASACGLLP